MLLDADETVPMSNTPSGAPPRDLRAATLEAAARLLAAEGPSGLSIRRIAVAGCSTISVYHYFDGKQGLLDALYVEGFKRLSEAQGEREPADESRGRCSYPA